MPLNIKNKEKSILVVDVDPFFGNTICSSLSTFGYRADYSSTADDAVSRLERSRFDLIVGDQAALPILRKWLDEKARASGEFIPMVVAMEEGFNLADVDKDGGVDEFIQKPLRLPELLKRVTNLLRVRQLHQRLLEQTNIIENWSQSLEEIVMKQDGHLTRLSKFVSPQLANALLSDSQLDPLSVHRRDVSVMFVDLKGFTAFSEAAEPEEVREVLEQFYSIVGESALRFGGTIGNFVGDAVMVFFNDPVEYSDHQLRAVKAAVEIREQMRAKLAFWRERSYQLCCGLGIAEGYATIGGLGFQEFKTYTVIGTVTNLAARFCDEAENCDVVTSHRFFARVESFVHGESRGDLNPRGIPYPIKSYRLLSLKEEPVA
jgi:class 3 adenylate cyclase/CheY-like chemotaxis protein